MPELQQSSVRLYLPKQVWEMYAAFGPVKGRNDEAVVEVVWQEGQIITESR